MIGRQEVAMVEVFIDVGTKALAIRNQPNFKPFKLVRSGKGLINVVVLEGA